MPSARLPPRCGQRLLSAKKSPERLNTTMARPFTSTSLRVPGGISSTLATTWPAIVSPAKSIKPVERARVLAQHLAAALVIERRRQGEQRVVEIPMRIVAREHDVV